MNIEESKNDKKINLFEIVKVDLKSQKVQCVRADGTYPNPIRTISFERIARHLPTTNGRINTLQLYLADNVNDELKKSTKGIAFGGPRVKGYVGNIGWQPEVRGLINVDLERYPELTGLSEVEVIPADEWHQEVKEEIQQMADLTDSWNNETILSGLNELFTDQFDSSTENVTEETLERAQRQQGRRRFGQIDDNTSIIRQAIESRSLLGRFIDSLVNYNHEESIRIMNEEVTKNETKKDETKKEESIIDLSGERTKFWNETTIPDLGTPMKIEPETHVEPERRGSTSTPRMCQTSFRTIRDRRQGRTGSTSTSTVPEPVRRSERNRTKLAENAYIDGKNEINPS